ncbi:hypothetical protein LTR22_022718 [Elasticomyces elasticus]|nr:hypothetical protein LTR22_022718 [Elasticomyces elasticus]KAK4907648.1 hypothetical protein LTR49_023348 [Elasticomyces elasticus]KAK5747819.1 hypothetical protein LTS12_022125 [Elasticomyces elasticus]
MQYTASIIAVGLAVQQAAATGWDVSARGYSNPANTNNECSSSQQGGYDWSGLSQGSFSSYGSNSFSGFSCADAPAHKRDALSKRGFQSKCIAGGLDEKPSISCDGQEDKMSIDTYHISSSEDTDIDCHYEMPDGSTCKETHSCSSEGSIIQNSQCGGAKGVTFQPAGGASSGCTMSIHSIGFNCGSASSSVTVATPTPSPSSSSTTAETTSDVYSLSRSSSSASSVETSPVTTSSEVSSVSTPVISSYASSTTAATTSDVISNSRSSSSESSIETSPVTSSESSSISTPVISSYGSSSTAETTSDVVSLSRSSSSVSSVETSPVTSSESSAVTSSISTPVISSYGSSTTAETTSDVISNSRSSSVETSPVTVPTSYPVYNISSSSSSEAGPVTSSSASTTASIISYSTSTVYSTTCSTSISSGSTVVVTLTTATSITICPVTATETGITSYSSSSVSSTVVSPVTNSTSTTVSASTYPTPDTPDVLPSCLNTWMYETGCKDNSDSDCYCKDAEFVKHVYGCISAWAGSNEDTTAAASQFMGICAPYVPANPAVITGCPSTITPVATPTPYVSSSEVSPASSNAPAVPSTITYYSTQEVTITSCAADITNCPASSTVISVSSVPISTSVVTPSSSSEVSPASTSPSGYSPPAYMTSESSSVAATTPAPSTITFYSTQGVTVTSCGPEVTNCPASSTVVSATSIAVSTSVIIPTYSGVTAAPSSSLVSPASDSSAATSPGSTPAPSCPVTTLTYSSPVTIPATYSTGVSSGLAVANSSITTSLVTTVTVPQVVFTTQTVTANGQTSTLTGLAAGGPSSAAATPTVGPVGASPPAYATTMASSFGTSFAPSATGTGSPIQPYTGAGAKLSGASFAGLAMGAVAALFVL